MIQGGDHALLTWPRALDSASAAEVPSRHPGGTDHSRARFLLGVSQEDQVTYEILRVGVHDRPQQREGPAFAVHGVLPCRVVRLLFYGGATRERDQANAIRRCQQS